MQIVFLDTYPVNGGDLPWDDFSSLGEFVSYASTPASLLVARCQEAEVLITNKCKITAEVIAQLPNLECICIAATGYDNVDITAAREHNIKVCNVAGYSTQSVVQHVFAMLLSHLNEPRRYAEGVKRLRWANSEYFAYSDLPIRSLESMTMGVMGFGTIGQAVAQVALSLGMDVVAHRRQDLPSPIEGVRMVDQDELLSSADILTVHVPATALTIGMINRNFLGKLKEDCILINTARGALVVESDLLDWLLDHPRATALLDVLHQEPPSTSNRLYQLSNCMITPHQAWMGVAARQKLLNGLVENIKSYQAGTLVGLT